MWDQPETRQDRRGGGPAQPGILGREQLKFGPTVARAVGSAGFRLDHWNRRGGGKTGMGAGSRSNSANQGQAPGHHREFVEDALDRDGGRRRNRHPGLGCSLASANQRAGPGNRWISVGEWNRSNERQSLPRPEFHPANVVTQSQMVQCGKWP